MADLVKTVRRWETEEGQIRLYYERRTSLHAAFPSELELARFLIRGDVVSSTLLGNEEQI